MAENKSMENQEVTIRDLLGELIAQQKITSDPEVPPGCKEIFNGELFTCIYGPLAVLEASSLKGPVIPLQSSPLLDDWLDRHHG